MRHSATIDQISLAAVIVGMGLLVAGPGGLLTGGLVRVGATNSIHLLKGVGWPHFGLFATVAGVVVLWLRRSRDGALRE
jgi:hypothetical protein